MSDDSFSKLVRTTLGQRAGYLCSHCRHPTSGPHSDPNKPLITGDAAHICAKSEDGPRFDESQTSAERKSAANGIWLCKTCHPKIDQDWRLWPAARLHEMKVAHETWIAAEGMIPSMPAISVTTRMGLRTSSRVPSITAEMAAELREQELIIHNANRVQIHNIQFDLVLPEPLLTYGEVTKNAATRINANPNVKPWIVETIQPHGEVIPHRRPTMNHRVDIPVVSALEEISISFYTLDPRWQVMWHGAAPVQPVDIDELHRGNFIKFYIEGTYQFVLREEFVVAHFFVPFRYRFRDRIISSLPAESSRGSWDVSPTIYFPSVELKS